MVNTFAKLHHVELLPSSVVRIRNSTLGILDFLLVGVRTMIGIYVPGGNIH